MKLLRLLPLFFLVACAHTELRDARTGKVIFRTESDASQISYSGNGVTFSATNLNHSKTNTIMGKNFTNGATAVGASIATSGILGVLH